LALLTNSPWTGTGYGTQTALFGSRLPDLNYQVAFSAFFGLKGASQPWKGNGREFKVYPGDRDPYGNDVLGAHAQDWFDGRRGLVVLLTDPWVLNSKLCSQIPILAWTPVDHQPLMRRTHNWLQDSKAVPLAMSRFGEQVMKTNGFNPLYCPHAFDSAVFRPCDRAAAREALHLPQDAFVVGMVAANRGTPSRKCFAQALAAFGQLQRKIGREAVLYLHTALEHPEGENLVALCESVGVVPVVTDPYRLATGIPPDSVAALMGAFDVLLNPAQGEGFGVPMVEAQACGTPVICTDFSASPEVAPARVGNWNVSGHPVWTNFDAWQTQPDIMEIVGALVEAYEEPAAERLVRRASVRDWAVAEYEVEHVLNTYMKPALEDAFARIRWEGRKVGRAG
jgi:glycosyltransferase involved in cell wall biosynthesis